MRKASLAAGAVLSTMLLAGPALAWTVKGSADEEREVRVAADKVPPCAQSIIARELDSIIVVPKHRLDRDDMRIDATSFRFTHHTYIDRAVLDDQSVIAHEMGHFYDWYMHDSQHLLFQESLRADFADMSDVQKEHNRYLETPEEAYAELFALRAVGHDYYFKLPHHYDLELLHRSQHVLDATFCHAEPRAQTPSENKPE